MLLAQLFASAWWRMPAAGNTVHLTFDDGPHPATTPFILEQLARYDMNATFFCLGRSVERHPGLFRSIVDAGHAVGLHTYSHLNGWKSDPGEYLADLQRSADLIGSRLFRPPYGKLSWKLWQELKDNYQIVMWSLSPEDYLEDIADELLLDRLTSRAVAGEIVLLHENDKSAPHIHKVLPKYLDWLQDAGFTSEKLAAPKAGKP